MGISAFLLYVEKQFTNTVQDRRKMCRSVDGDVSILILMNDGNSAQFDQEHILMVHATVNLVGYNQPFAKSMDTFVPDISRTSLLPSQQTEFLSTTKKPPS
jgi:hypothetical protein